MFVFSAANSGAAPPLRLIQQNPAVAIGKAEEVLRFFSQISP